MFIKFIGPAFRNLYLKKNIILKPEDLRLWRISFFLSIISSSNKGSEWRGHSQHTPNFRHQASGFAKKVNPIPRWIQAISSRIRRTEIPQVMANKCNYYFRTIIHFFTKNLKNSSFWEMQKFWRLRLKVQFKLKILFDFQLHVSYDWQGLRQKLSSDCFDLTESWLQGTKSATFLSCAGSQATPNPSTPIKAQKWYSASTKLTIFITNVAHQK